jgi:hypothetical protein
MYSLEPAATAGVICPAQGGLRLLRRRGHAAHGEQVGHVAKDVL